MCRLTSTHYNCLKFKAFSFQLMGFAAVSIYQRSVLFVASALSHVNLNHVLCHSEADPFYKFVGDYYYVYSEFYLNLLSYLVKLGVLAVAFYAGVLVSMVKAYRWSRGFTATKINQAELKKML